MRRIHTLIAILLLVSKGYSQFVINQKLTRNVSLTSGIFYMEDPSTARTIKDVIAEKEYKPVETDVPNFGMSASSYWLKIAIDNKLPAQDYLLQVSQPGLDEIDFYQADKHGAITEIKGGEILPFKVREFFDPNFIYRIHLDSSSVTNIFLRVRSRDNLKIPIIIGPQESVFETNKIRDFILGIFSGIMVVMFLYNTFLFITVRDRTYLYYIVYLATVILTQVSIQGYTFQYLWPYSSFLAQWSPFIFSPLVGISAAYFMRLFLNTAHYCPLFDKGFKYFNFGYAVAFAFALAGVYHLSYLLITLVATAISMYMFIVGIIVYRKDYKPARFFLLAWSLFLFGVTVYAMTNLGVLPLNNFTFYMMPLGAAAEVVLLSLALADRINVLKKEKEQSQAEALLISQQNQRLITEQNVLLEQKVHERTIELEETNDELSSTLTNLKEAQAQLVNAEKMASLGQLTAGIAHEINNPINFVSANLKPLKTDIGEVLEVVSRYEQLQVNDNLDVQLKEIDSFKKKIDLPYLKQEIGSLLVGIEDGAKRTAEIVSGLKNFSRLDESDIKEADINEGIESTLVILRSSVPRNTEVVLNLGKVPYIECYPGKLNQVFMNLLSNAIYAMTKKTDGSNNRLIISTFEKDDKVYAVFEDTGIGMSKDVKEKIFEPFFTTKDVGEGTGLGMSIVFKIIESHHARIEVDSTPGVGTRIAIVLNKMITYQQHAQH